MAIAPLPVLSLQKAKRLEDWILIFKAVLNIYVIERAAQRKNAQPHGAYINCRDIVYRKAVLDTVKLKEALNSLTKVIDPPMDTSIAIPFLTLCKKSEITN